MNIKRFSNGVPFDLNEIKHGTIFEVEPSAGFAQYMRGGVAYYRGEDNSFLFLLNDEWREFETPDTLGEAGRWIDWSNIKMPRNFVPDPNVAAMVWVKEQQRIKRHNKSNYISLAEFGLDDYELHFLQWEDAEDEEKRNQVKFIANPKHGQAGRFTTSKFGKYLKRYFDHLEDHVIRDIVGELTSRQFDLTVLTDGDEICKAYEDVSCSCMGGVFGMSDDNPVRAYANSPDVGVAYLEGKARAVVNRKDKKYYTIYGDESRMIPMLKRNGYTKASGFLLGCRLSIVEDSAGDYRAPYLDGSYNNIDIEDGYYVVVDQGDYVAESTGGDLYHKRPQRQCECCGEYHDEEDVDFFESTDGEEIGECCAGGDRYVWAYTGFQTRLVDSHHISVWYFNGEHYTEEGLDYSDLVIAEDTGEVAHVSDVYVDEDGFYYEHEENVPSYETEEVANG